MSITKNYYQYFLEKEKNKNKYDKTEIVSDKTYDTRRKYYLKNRDKIIEYSKQYYQDHKEEIRQKNKNNKYINKLYYQKWYEENKYNLNYKRSKKRLHDKYVVLEPVNYKLFGNHIMKPKSDESTKIKKRDPNNPDDFIIYF